jgi:Glucosyl transferase GtrII
MNANLGPSRRGSSPAQSNSFWLLCPFLAVLFCYAPAWLVGYGFSEDYRLLSFYDHGATNRTLMIAEGRPIQALWTNLVYGHLSGIESLATVRFANVLLLGLAAVLLAATWRRGGLGAREAALAGAAVFTLPPFQIIAATAAFGVKPPVLILSILAAIVAGRATKRDRIRARLIELFLAFVLLTLAMLGYQPAAMMFFAVSSLLLLAPDDELPVFKRKLKAFAMVGFSAIVIGFVIYKVGQAVFPRELAGLDRAGLATDPVLKLLWFLLYPLDHALNPWILHLNRPLALAVGVVVLAGLWIHLRGREGRRMRFVVGLALVPLSYLPNLMVAENWSSFRSQMALASLIFVYIVIATGVLTKRAGPWLQTGVLAVLTLVGMTTAWLNVDRLFVRPQQEELAIVRQTLNGVSASYGRIGVVMSSERETLAPFSLYDEFGRPSTSFTWGVANLPWLVLREQRPDVDTASIRVYDVTTANVPVDTVIDWGAILRAAKAEGRRR